MKTIIISIALLSVSSLFAGNIYVNNVTGKNTNNGLALDKALKSITIAINKAKAGDTVHLAKTGRLYRQSADFTRQKGGSKGAPIILDGHGVTLSGADICAPDNWREWKNGIFKSTKQVSNRFMMIDGKMVFAIRNFNVLKPGQFCYMPNYYKRLFFYPPNKQEIAQFTVEIGQADGSTVKLDPEKWQRCHSKTGAVRRYTDITGLDLK